MEEKISKEDKYKVLKAKIKILDWAERGPWNSHLNKVQKEVK